MTIKFSLENKGLIDNIKTKDNLHIKRNGKSMRISSVEIQTRTIVDYKDVEFDAEDDFSFVIPQKSLIKTLNDYQCQDEKTINMQILESGKLSTYNESKKFKYKIPIEVGEIAERQDAKECKTITIKIKDLISKMPMVKISTAVDDSRSVMTGIYFDFKKDKKILMVGTDGRRLSIAPIGYESTDKDLESVSMPLAFLDTLISFTSLIPQEDVDIEIFNNLVVAHIGNVMVESQLFEGKFPDYQTILDNNNHSKTFQIKNKDFKNIVRSANVTYAMNMNVFVVEGNCMILNAIEDIREASCEVPIIKTDEKVKFAFNSYLFMEYLKANPDQDIITCSFDTSRKPFMFKNDECVYIAMPMKIEE